MHLSVPKSITLQAALALSYHIISSCFPKSCIISKPSHSRNTSTCIKLNQWILGLRRNFHHFTIQLNVFSRTSISTILPVTWSHHFPWSHPSTRLQDTLAEVASLVAVAQLTGLHFRWGPVRRLTTW